VNVGRVLVVDDTADIRLLLRAVLSHVGHDVSEAATGAEALSMLAQGTPFDAVVLDVQMPDMDGWQILASIREQACFDDMPVLLCTVKSQLEDTRRGWELGCDGLLNKPFSVAAMADEEAAVLARSQAERLAHRELRRQELWAGELRA